MSAGGLSFNREEQFEAAQRSAPVGCVAVEGRGTYSPVYGRPFVYVLVGDVEQAVAKQTRRATPDDIGGGS